ncbi:hypothetical protein RRG08_041064 [Elysia crispata]|uniref:Uncharacterized protein n=1 Tax=Elysia crispata TaxID=231223 RepID=A0AAE1CUL5_9GAST|nr:hypothetical protein RRG08_041064 [Elysia crispata]
MSITEESPTCNGKTLQEEAPLLHILPPYPDCESQKNLQLQMSYQSLLHRVFSFTICHVNPLVSMDAAQQAA